MKPGGFYPIELKLLQTIPSSKSKRSQAENQGLLLKMSTQGTSARIDAFLIKSTKVSTFKFIVMSDGVD